MTMMTEFTLRQRQVIKLVGGEGMTYAACGKVLGISAKTVAVYADQVKLRSGLKVPPRVALSLVWHMASGQCG